MNARQISRVERMAGRMEEECRRYWDWYRAAVEQHGETIVSKSGHTAARMMENEASAVRALLKEVR